MANSTPTRRPGTSANRGDYGDAIRELRKPVIAAVNGYAYGGGLELALACDIRLAADTATFAAPEIKLGWIGGSGQSALLAHSVGPGNAALMLLTGDPIDAAQALAWGLVSKVVPPADSPLLELLARARRRPSIAPYTACLRQNCRRRVRIRRDRPQPRSVSRK